MRGPWDGVYLFRDFVTVPDPVLGANTVGGEGSPRAVPLDAVVAVLSDVLPPGVVGRLVLVAPLLLVGSGMTVLLRQHGPVATSLGAGLAIANPYAVERLLLGEAPSLLGWAMIPWLVAAVRVGQPVSVRVLLVLAAAVPATLTPTGAVTAAVTVLVTALVAGPRRSEGEAPPSLGQRALDGIALLAPIALLSLPWIITALEHPTAGKSPDAADALAVRSDGSLAAAGSVATLGGVWAQWAWPGSRSNGFVTTLSLFLVIGAAAAWFVLRRAHRSAPRRREGRPLPSGRSVDLAAAGYAVSVLAALGLAGPLLPLVRAAQAVPGLTLLSDTHRWLGWAALAVAALLAVGVATTLEGLDSRRLTGVGAAVTLIAAGVLTVPDAPGRLVRDLHPVAVPAEWAEVVQVVNDGPAGAVLVLPWQPLRQVDWAGPVPFVDPFPRALEPQVVHARELHVQRGDRELRVGGADPALAEHLTGDGRLDPGLLREEGINRVLIWLQSPGEVPRGAEDLHEVHRGEHWLVVELDAPVQGGPRSSAARQLSPGTVSISLTGLSSR